MIPIQPWMTPLQISIWDLRCNGHTYQQITNIINNSYNVKLNDDNIVTCLLRTAQGYPWKLSHEGGRLPYLCCDDAIILINLIENKSEDLESMPTSIVVEIAHELKIKRAQYSKQMLESLGCPRLAQRIDLNPEPPTIQWLSQWAKSNNLNIKIAESLDKTRRRTCNVFIIQLFFQKFQDVIASYNPNLILNADETALTTNRKFRVVVPANEFPIVENSKINTHITAMLTITPNAHVFPPFIILKDLSNIPHDLIDMIEHCSFISTMTGWMNTNAFTKWCIFICHQIQMWRTTMPHYLASQRILIVIDGHNSRLNPGGIKYLHDNAIDILTLPAHCSHVMQPFDVVFCNVLKTEHGKILRQYIHKDNQSNMTSSYQRSLLVHTFYEAYIKTNVKRICSSSFKKAGLVPINPNEPLESPYVRNNLTQLNEQRYSINNRYFGNENEFIGLQQYCGTNFTEQPFTYQQIRDEWYLVNNSRALTSIPKYPQIHWSPTGRIVKYIFDN